MTKLLIDKGGFWKNNTFLIGLIITTIIALVIGVYADELKDWKRVHIDKKIGIEISPKEINYNCNNFGMGVTKTITIRNYDDKSLENFVLTISWQNNQNLNQKLEEIDSNSLRGEIESITLTDIGGELFHRVYFITSIKPKDILEFDLSLFSDNCSNDFLIYINKYQPIAIVERS